MALKTVEVMVVCAAANDIALKHASKECCFNRFNNVIKYVTRHRDFIYNNIIVSVPSLI